MQRLYSSVPAQPRSWRPCVRTYEAMWISSLPLKLSLIHISTEKKYYGKSFKGIYEIASLTGNITQQGENPYLHLHMVIGNPLVGECHGGHLNRAVISATAEIFITAVSYTHLDVYKRQDL